MKNEEVSVASPDELDKHLKHSSLVTWIILGATIAAMLAFFVWSFLFKIPIKLSGTAKVVSGQATLMVEKENKDKLEIGQKVYVLDQEGIISFNDENEPVVLNLKLADGNYTYRTDIVLKEIHPIDFLINR